MATAVYPVGDKKLRAPNIEFVRSGLVVGRALPVLGLPTSLLIHKRGAELQQAGLGIEDSRLVYDELGIHPEHSKHLDWLNQRLDPDSTIQTQPLSTVGHWMGSL
jgi:hypothetical protein